MARPYCHHEVAQHQEKDIHMYLLTHTQKSYLPKSTHHLNVLSREKSLWLPIELVYDLMRDMEDTYYRL